MITSEQALAIGRRGGFQRELSLYPGQTVADDLRGERDGNNTSTRHDTTRHDTVTDEPLAR